MSKNKEYRVYVLSTKDISDMIKNETDRISSDVIYTWNNYKTLPDLAYRFISKAEELGRVFSLEGFNYAFNEDSIVSQEDDYIFITNKHQ